MNRTLMISDIHGCNEQLNKLLAAVQYDAVNDTLVLLGDYVDRGPNSKEAVNRVMELVEKGNVIALRGNHDQRLVDLITSDAVDVQNKFLAHGGLQTLQSYCDFIEEPVTLEALSHFKTYMKQHYMHHIDFLKLLPLYYEDSNHIYVHAGLNPKYKKWTEQPDHDFMYIKSEFHQAKPWNDKTVIFGHTRTIELQETANIWFGEGKIGIDGGCAYGLQLNCLIYEEGEYTAVRILSD